MDLLVRITVVSLLRNLLVLKRPLTVDHCSMHTGTPKKGPKTRRVYLNFFSGAAGLKSYNLQLTIGV